MSAHPRGIDLNPDSIDLPVAPLVYLHPSGDLMVKTRKSPAWIRINEYGEVKFVPDVSLRDGVWLAPVVSEEMS